MLPPDLFLLLHEQRQQELEQQAERLPATNETASISSGGLGTACLPGVTP